MGSINRATLIIQLNIIHSTLRAFTQTVSPSSRNVSYRLRLAIIIMQSVLIILPKMRKIRRNNSSHSILPCKRSLGAITITAHDIPSECDRPSLQSVPHSKVRLPSSRTMTSLSQGHHRINPLDFTNTHETHAHTRVKTKRRRDEEIVRIHTPATCCEFGARGQHL